MQDPFMVQIAHFCSNEGTTSIVSFAGYSHKCTYVTLLRSHQAEVITWVYATYSGSVQSADALMRQIAHFRCKLLTPK